MAKERTIGRSIIKRRPQRARRTSLRRPSRVWTQRVMDLWSEPAFSWGVLIFLAFFLIGGGLAAWVREQPLIGPGRVMDRTRVVRDAFVVTNQDRTEASRENARQQTPRVYREIPGVIDGVVAEVRNLPAAVAAAESVEAMDQGLRSAFRLDQARFNALKGIASDDTARTAWAQATDTLEDVLTRNPLLERAEWQRVGEGLDRRIELLRGEQSVMAPRDQAINIGDQETVASRIPRLVGSSGFADAGAEAVTSRLTVDPRATFQRDDNLTAEREETAVASIQDVVETRAQGQVIFTRGDVLTERQYEVYRQELAHYATTLSGWKLWLGRGSAAIGVVAAGLVLAGYLSLFAARIAGRPSRMAWIVGLMLAAQALAAVLTVLDPAFIAFTVSVPVLLVGILVAIAYDQKSAIAIGSLTAGLVALSLGLSIGQLMAVIAGLAAAIWFLRELRDRRSLVGVSLAAGATLAVAWSTVGLLGMPITGDTVRQAIGDGMKAGFGGLIAGGVTLFVLPLVERAFDITTGMTLIELRDPKQPLLRDLQRQAPGTYNHALNVASIAESAADAIGADGLLTYVGALYHDVGKMNKPEYFVENQSGGINKHDRLSPAMSLLVIIGHVKDGLEIAAEYNLPRVLRHFIEGHHGTTLVEFFYRRAVEQAASTDTDGDGETEDERLPDEVDFRYPGPKPRTKECAILMLADAVESATRAMAEPTPSRIESLVRQLADKRLIDGQFDECDLTLRELHVIVESISKTVTSIYHGRIKYPGSAPARKPAKPAEKTA